MNRILGHLSLAAAIVLMSGCAPGGGTSTAQAPDGRLDLISLFPVAEQLEETSQIPLRFDSRRAALLAGLTPVQHEEGKKYVAMIEREAHLEAILLRSGDRQLHFEAKAFGTLGGPENQQLSLFFNGEEVGSWNLDGGEWQALTAELPAEHQRIGRNLLTFRCEQIASNQAYTAGEKGDAFPRIAAYLRDLTISGGKPTKKDESFFQLAENGAVLRQNPDSAFSYGFKPTSDARLMLGGTAFAEKIENSLQLYVETRTDAESKWSVRFTRDITLEDVSASEPVSAEIDLADAADEPLEIRFRVVGDGAYVVWNKLQLDTKPAEKHIKENAPINIKAPRHAVIIVADASNPRFYGCYGNEEGLTPNIDAFAADALRFTSAVAPGAQTAKTVSTIFSGLLPDFHGVFGVETAFPEHLPTLPGAFRDSGFRTVAFAGIKVVSSNFDLSRDFHEVVDLRRPEYIRDETSEMDMETLISALDSAAKSGERLFLYMHLLPPHWPYNPPEPFNLVVGDDQEVDTAFKNRVKRMLRFGGNEAVGEDIEVLKYLYRRNLRYADHVVGIVLDRMRELGMYDESLIILTADHGEAFGEHGDILHGKNVYEEMIHVPFIVRVPQGSRGVVEQQVGLVDIFPTFKKLFALSTEAEHLHGRSMFPLLAGGEQPPRDYYFSRTGSDRIVIFSLRGERYKLVQNLGETELFDLRADPFELTNLAERLPALAAYLRTRGRMIVEAGRAYRIFESRDAELDDEDIEELKDLGYLQ